MTELLFPQQTNSAVGSALQKPTKPETVQKVLKASNPYYQFPTDFLWGVAAASYQIEGAFQEDGRGKSIWDKLCERPGAIKNGDTGNVACDHYHRYESDFDLMASLNVKNYRFSFAWPRIFPTGRGKINQPGLDFYDRLIDSMLERGIQPTATCYHWDLPQALEDKGGWRNRETAQAFGEFAALLSSQFSDRIANWSTLNEPWCSWWLGYHKGIHAPGARENGKVLYQVSHNLMLAHGLGVQALRANAQRDDLQVGIVHNSSNMLPFTESEADISATRKLWLERNGWLLSPMLSGHYPEAELESLGSNAPDIAEGDLKTIHQPLEYLGLNVYFAEEIIRASSGPCGLESYYPRTDFNWPITPEAIYWSVRFAHELFQPKKIYITENGCCYPDQVDEHGRVEDFARLNYLKENLKCLHRATQEGIPLKGYYLWSIFDNFEWAEGYAKRFGIVHVNFNNQKRTPKASALWYARVMEQNGL